MPTVSRFFCLGKTQAEIDLVDVNPFEDPKWNEA